MAMVYNAGEVLEIAIRIEQNAVGFYSKAADLKQRETRVDFLLNLAAMEKTHEEEFRSLRDELTEDERQEAPYDPYGEVEAYLRALAGRWSVYPAENGRENGESPVGGFVQGVVRPYMRLGSGSNRGGCSRSPKIRAKTLLFSV